MVGIDTLSVVSDVFQVLGFAETVLHTGKALYELFDKARAASRGIAIFLLELQALLAVVTSVQIVISEHARSAFELEDGHALRNVRAILTLINHDFLYLKSLLGQSVVSAPDTWLSRVQRNIRWALHDNDITAAKERLARYTQNLNTMLSATGRRNDIILRTEIQQIRVMLGQTQSTAMSCPHPLQAGDNLIQSRALKTDLRVPRRRLRVVSPPASDACSFKKSTSPSALLPPRSAGIITARVSTPDARNVSRDLLCPTVTIREMDHGEFVVDAGNYKLHEVTKSAFLLQDSLSLFFEACSPGGQAPIAKAEVRHSQLLLDLFVSSALIASAHHITNRYNCTGASTFERRFSKDGTCTISLPRHPGSSGIFTRKPVPRSFEQRSTTFDTNMGVIKAHVVIARSETTSGTFAGGFTYWGNPGLGLTPFTVAFTSVDSFDCAFLTAPMPRVGGVKYHLETLLAQEGICGFVKQLNFAFFQQGIDMTSLFQVTDRMHTLDSDVFLMLGMETWVFAGDFASLTLQDFAILGRFSCQISGNVVQITACIPLVGRREM